MPELVPAVPGSPDWLAARVVGETVTDEHMEPPQRSRPVLKLTPYSRHGLIHGAYDQARPALRRRGYSPAYAGSWMYRRGFARGFLLAKEASRG